MQSTRLAKVPAWVGEFTQLEALELGGDCLENFSLRTIRTTCHSEQRETPRRDYETTELANVWLTALPAGLFFQLGALKQLTLSGLSNLQAMPDASGLTSLEIWTIDRCSALTVLPAGLEQLGALKQLTLSVMSGLEVSETFGRMTALERLTLSDCYKLKTLPVSIMHLSQRSSYRSLPVSNLKKHTNRER